MKEFRYELIVEETGSDTWTARLDDASSPLRGAGSTPLAAVRSLCESLVDWQSGLAQMFGVDIPGNATQDNAGDTHVYPIDGPPHELTAQCWCRPMRDYQDRNVLIHSRGLN